MLFVCSQNKTFDISTLSYPLGMTVSKYDISSFNPVIINFVRIILIAWRIADGIVSII